MTQPKAKDKPKRRGRPPTVKKIPMHMFGLRVPLKDWTDWTAHCDRLGVGSLGGRLVDLIRKDTKK